MCRSQLNDMKEISVLLTIRSDSESLSRISKVVGISHDSDSHKLGAKVKGPMKKLQPVYTSTKWLREAKKGKSLHSKITNLLKFLPSDFKSRLKNLKQSKAYISIAIVTDIPQAEFEISNRLLNQITNFGLAVEFIVFSKPFLESVYGPVP
jgi:hypothetical protein